MKLSFIAPFNAVNEISSLGDMDFCLAPYLKIKEYKDYFLKSKKYTIIDNGIAENVLIPSKTLIQSTIDIKANEIIVPDKIGDYKRTKRRRESFLKKFYPILKKNKIKIQSVIQGNNLYEYMNNLKELLDDIRVDVIGIPFRMNYCHFKRTTKEENRMYNRVFLLKFFENQMSKPIHCLGTNLPIELLHLKRLNVRSIDSKLMTRYGLSKKIFNLHDVKKPSKKIYIDKGMMQNSVNITIKNINKLRDILK